MGEQCSPLRDRLYRSDAIHANTENRCKPFTRTHNARPYNDFTRGERKTCLQIENDCRGGHWPSFFAFCTGNIFPRVDHSWSIFRTIRGIDKNENRTTVLPFHMVRAYSRAHRFFSPGKRDFSSGKRHFSSGKSTEQRRAENRTEEQRRAEHSIAENSRADKIENGE